MRYLLAVRSLLLLILLQRRRKRRAEELKVVELREHFRKNVQELQLLQERECVVLTKLYHAYYFFYSGGPCPSPGGVHNMLRVRVCRPVGTKLILGGGLKRGASKASQNGGPGACPRENFS